ncbi:MAG: ATP-binding protein [Pseudomonadota bacterium]|nr:ATP-binding protein [Pseudomonadota bacterium]
MRRLTPSDELARRDSAGRAMSTTVRIADRRAGPRRGSESAASSDESWFGGADADTDLQGDNSRFGAAWRSTEYDPDDSQPSSRQPQGNEHAGATTFERIYRAFIAARAALGVALVVTLGVAGVFGLRPTQIIALVSVAYAALAVSMWLLPRFRPPAPQALARLQSPQWIATIGADVVCFIALHVLAVGSSLNYEALLVLPVLMAGILTPRLLALATAAAVTLALLFLAWLGLPTGSDPTLLMTQAGLAGSGFFVVTVLAGEVARRLAREEMTARGSLEMARQQAQLNQLVIEEMQDGVLVVDRRGRVRAANPAARKLLAASGLCRMAPFQLRGVAAWEGLVKTVEQAFNEGSWPATGRDVVLQFEANLHRTLRARIRFTRRREPQSSEEFCVLFLEDLVNMQARSRQEKLAAMGRVSAGIAHEIRNPLAAIAQANALLSEDAVDPAQRQLTRLVTDNVERLKRIVDDVMEVAPGQRQAVGAIDATALVGAVYSDWIRDNGVQLGEQSVLRVDLPADPVGVFFDAEHLRRVMVNLLDNALRHATSAPGAIMLRLDAGHEFRVFLSVLSDGAAIATEVEPYLFEPFFSTRSRGTGLGLYICRELCERYGASIDYRLRPHGGTQRNGFFVDMRRAALSPAEASLHLTG